MRTIHISSSEVRMHPTQRSSGLQLCGVCLSIAAVLLAFSGRVHAHNPRVQLAENGGLLVDGKPFLPIFVWAQPSNLLGYQKGLGFNVVHAGEEEAKDPTVGFLDAAHKQGLLALVDHQRFSPDLKDHPAVLAWTVEHEPEMPEDPPYQPDLAKVPGAIWIEGEQAKESTLGSNPWLDKPFGKLSGGKWLTASTKGEGKAVYEFEVSAAGPHTLWIREFNKSWTNPTRWTIDDQSPQETPRSLKAEEMLNLGGGRGAGWAKYGSVDLQPGKHALTLEVVAGRTSGDATKPTTPDAVWAIDAICLVPGDGKFPSAKSLGHSPRRLPAIAKTNNEHIKAADPKALTWIVLTAFFHKNYNKLPLSLYEEYLQHADIVSFDHYPITGWNQPAKLAEVAVMTKQLVGMARKGQPVWTVVEASDQELTWTPPQTKGPTAQEMRAEAWMSIASGAKGVGYFTISFGRGKQFKWNNLTPEIEEELKRTNGELAELAGPIVMGDTTKALVISNDESTDKAAEGHAIVAIRKEYEGKTFVIAVNVTRQEVRPKFTLEDFVGTSAEVWKENRRVAVTDGTIVDTFAPLEAHVYRMSQ